jgi:Glutathione S-transferase N-terminal domain/Glutathione S-transferase, C-terminal domain
MENNMITLYGTGPMFGLPHASPFVMKAELLLKMSGLPYRNQEANLRKAPKGKIPWIEDDGKLIADSTFIRLHLEEGHGIDFSGGYSDRELAVGWAIEKMLEEHLYWLNVNDRWLIDENFWKGPVHFFDKVPALIRPLIVRMVRRKVRQNNHAQGIGRHGPAERLVLGRKAIDCVSAILSDSKYMLGDTICTTDATAYGALLSLTCPIFKSEIREYAETKANVMRYLGRMTAEFFPGFERG